MQLPKLFHGRVVLGQGRGRRLGFPTANLELPKDFPATAYGVYACWVWVGNKWRPGVAHLGPAASFGEKVPVLEVHILDWTGELNQGLTAQITQKIRDTAIFSRPEELILQIHHDAMKAARLLRATTPPDSPPKDFLR